MAGDRERYTKWAEDTPAEGRQAIQAATVILLRDGAQGLETLMLRRNSKLAFVGGMWVFPGGRVDPEDCLPGDDEIDSARRAAIRESEEEAGLRVDEQALVTLSHWTPPPITPRRFLTWFFAAPAPAGTVKIDDGEIKDHLWIHPTAALEKRDAGEIELAPPTFVTLVDLQQYSSTAEALQAIDGNPTPAFSTRIVMSDAGPTALWQGDVGYEDSDTERDGPRHRLLMGEERWTYWRDARSD